MQWLAFLIALLSSTHAHPPVTPPRHHLALLVKRATLRGKAPLLLPATPANLATGSLSASQGCSTFYTVRSGDTCSLVVAQYGISSLRTFYAWNPSIDSACSNLYVGKAYCVKGATGTTSVRSAPTSAAQQAPAIPSTTVALTSSVPLTATSAPSSSVYSGQGTWFEAGLGACGSTVNGQTALIVAASHLLYDSYGGGYASTGNPNLAPICGKQMMIKYGSKNVTVVVQDRCEGCAMYDVDMSIAAFTRLADLSLGRIAVTWSWL